MNTGRGILNDLQHIHIFSFLTIVELYKILFIGNTTQGNTTQWSQHNITPTIEANITIKQVGFHFLNIHIYQRNIFIIIIVPLVEKYGTYTGRLRTVFLPESRSVVYDRL
jgi:hypothetical protein